ncbi:expressed unknown protein [Seminavis robusta]|uniref:Uncharacterized protein n=1 Tax=Seminavis robusta TaxID=568900 RepID=A0A9N8HYQ8_9STRA|nr:expressed unknown protein [Seminavis robusta]|eukprot:Sro2053_g312710.1 n/a (165) ;mRNA; f:15848-16342
MKLSNILTCGAVLLSTATAFTVVPQTTQSLTRQYMFGGGGAGAVTEDDPEAQKKMEEAAAAMGMSAQEYQLGIKARMKLNEDLAAMRIAQGDPDTIEVVRDGNNPPQFLEINITEKGKALGQDAVSSEIVAALKKGAEGARAGRAEAQKTMMQFIGDEMKNIGG